MDLITVESSFCSTCKKSLSNLNDLQIDEASLDGYKVQLNSYGLDTLTNTTTKSLSQVSLNGKLSSEVTCAVEYSDNNDKQQHKKLKTNDCKMELMTSLNNANDSDEKLLNYHILSEEKLNKTNTSENDTNKSKLQFQIRPKKKDFNKSNSNTIVSIVLNRKKRLAQLANDIFRLSSYLDEIRTAINAKEPAEIVTIPEPPIFDDYHSQFDFNNQKRFGALPIIRIQSAENNKSVAINGENQRQLLANHRQPLKRLNNHVLNQFNGRRSATVKNNKENQKGTAEKDTSSDSSSMYNYNPLKIPVVRN